MLRDTILESLKRATGEKEIHLEFPENEEFGDYATNVAMVLAKKEKKNPKELAEKIVHKLKRDKKLAKLVSKIEVAGLPSEASAKEGPAFINFFLSKDALLGELQKAIKQGDKYGSSDVGNGKTVLVEYSSPNIAKAFGIGHLRSTIIGQALYNLYKFLGYKTVGENHIGDWGTQFGMIIAQVVRKKLDIAKLSVETLEKLYVEFNKEAENNPELREVAKKWFQKLETGDKKAKKVWEAARKTSLAEFERVYAVLGVNIDNAHGESFYAEKMKGVVEELREKGLSKKSKGAEIVEFNDMPPAMLLKSDGGTTYYTRDLATVKYRINTYKPDIFIYEVGSEQKLHFQQVFETVKLLGWADGREFVHVAHGLFRFKHGKMATRRGETVKLEDVLNEAIKRARRIIDKSETPRRQGSAGQASRGLSKKEKESVAKAVGIGAIKYFDLSHHHSTDIIFDWGKMFVLEGNSAPYLQYTFTRTQSVLRKVQSTKHETRNSFEFNAEELLVLRVLSQFSEIIITASKSYSPNLLCNYLFDLAQKYNNFYACHRILDTSSERTKSEALSDNQHRILSDNLPAGPPAGWTGKAGRQATSDKRSEFRIALTNAVGQLLKTGLTLLGIETPKKM
jgi:arginyl-tRNA synthetase